MMPLISATDRKQALKRPRVEGVSSPQR